MYKEAGPYFLRLYLPILLVVSLVTYCVLWLDQSHRQQFRNESIQSKVELVVSNIELSFKNIISDLRYLAESHRVRRLASG